MALSKIFVAPKNGQGGVKKKKKTEKIFKKDGGKIFGTSGSIFAKIRFFEIGGVRSTLTSPGWPAPHPLAQHTLVLLPINGKFSRRQGRLFHVRRYWGTKKGIKTLN